MGISDLSVSAFRQMCGRAGRLGLDNEGEAILMTDAKIASLCEQLLTSELDPLMSSLSKGNGGGIEKLLLEMISFGKLSKMDQIMKFMECTLYWKQNSVENVSFSM